jgi:L-asparaginase II
MDLVPLFRNCPRGAGAMENPVLVELVRGPMVESRHRGAVAIVDAAGQTSLCLGDIARPVYPRSAVKALQALATVESGAADAFGLSEADLALACASHNGEPRHVETARAMLAKAGFGEAALGCGPQPPRREADLLALRVTGGKAGRIHNNCSGKHAAMLAFCRHLGAEAKGYSLAGHPVQLEIRRVVGEMTGTDLTAAPCGIDGCSVPSWAMPLSALARGFVRFATGEGLAPDRAESCARLRSAVAAHPFLVAGTGRFCTRVMEATGPAAFVKIGAEGVFCAAFPDRGVGVALKIDDGAGRAAEAVMANIVLALCGLRERHRAALERLAAPALTNWAGQEVGAVRPTVALVEALEALTGPRAG